MIFEKLLTSSEDIKQRIFSSIERREPLLITYFNQNCLNIYYQNESYKKLLDTKFLVYQADLGVFIFLRFFKGKKIRRIDTTAVNEIILSEFIRGKTPLTIVGGNFDEKFIYDKSKNRGMNLIGYQNGYFTEPQTANIIESLSKLESKVLIIGMGVPKQELFAERLSQTSNSKVIICVGNFFEFYFGTKKRAPVFVQKIGLEWIFRLFSEPRRLWKRYLLGIPVFFYEVMKLKFSAKNNKYSNIT